MSRSIFDYFKTADHNHLKLHILNSLSLAGEALTVREIARRVALNTGQEPGELENSIRATISKWRRFRKQYVKRVDGKKPYRYHLTKYGTKILGDLQERKSEGKALNLKDYKSKKEKVKFWKR